MKSSACLALLLGCAVVARAAVDNGRITVSAENLRPGTRIDLSGQWFYKPGYAVTTSEQPETESHEAGFIPVGVPQFLNRVHWWLDDSEEFNQHEHQRMKKLAFDTDRADDGWYLLEMEMPAIPKGRHLFVEFDGVAMKSRAYCNGHLLGTHAGMFSRFNFDLTPQLHPGTNRLAVYVSMEKPDLSTVAMGQAVTVNLTASKVKTMSKGMYGPMWPSPDPRSYDLHGIWQPVRLVARADAKLDDVWFKPGLEGGELDIRARLFDPISVVIKAEWVDDKTGQMLAHLQSKGLQPGTDPFVHVLTLRRVEPKLWSPAEPNLYRLRVTIEDHGGNILDEWNGKVGFRTFGIYGNQFYLNGHPWWLRGADHLPYGKNPWDPELPRKLIQLLHDGNIRITRTHGTPWNEAWLDAADEIGLGVSVEGIRPWALAGNVGVTPPELFQQWLDENRDVIQRCRNHPSVLLYTVGNEMLLRDQKNLEKWKQLSEVVKETRKMDPTRPVIASSEYERDPEFYTNVLQPNSIDDGDIDDLHRYNNWYGPSSFVADSKFDKEMKRNGGRRPLIGQEMSTGYPNLDNGLPVWRYTHDLLTPQAWVGIDSYPGSDPAVFLEHHRAVTKRWAEQLRFHRGTDTAGFMMFATECWFAHSYDPQRVSPYPVYDAVREADAPVGLAWETGRRRFYAGESLDTAVFISDDDDQLRDFQNLKLEVSFAEGNYESLDRLYTELTNVAKVAYGDTIRVSVRVTFPPASGDRHKVQMKLRLVQGNDLISETTDPIELFGRSESSINAAMKSLSLGPVLGRLAEQTFSGTSASHPQVILLGPAALESLVSGGSVRKQIEKGATAVIFSPGPGIEKMFPMAVAASKEIVGEFADFFPVAGTLLGIGLQPMDLKWWGRTNDWRTFVASEAERLRPDGPARELIRYIPPHGYIAADRLPDQYMTVLWELRLGKGRLWVCDLDLEQCADVDPAARRFAQNLFRAASDPHSTDSLPPIPSHEQLMKGRAEARAKR